MPRRRPAQRPYGEPAEIEDRELRRPAERQEQPSIETPHRPTTPAAPAATASSSARAQSKQDVPAAAGQGNLHPAVQGMMWAEVFGPPRAKRPYRGKK
ncbi:hypothetical protein [Paenibacillus thermotolerans]|nr:hypothetical protein [Paenibacillus sp. YIM B05601]